MERLTMVTAASDASSPLSLDALAAPATFEVPKRRRTSACDDLARLHFTDEVKQQLMESIGAAVDDVLDGMMRDDPANSTWKLRMRKNNVEYYEDRSTVRRGESHFCCASIVEAQVEDVVQLFVLADADTLLQRCRIMHDNVVNAQVLSVLESPSDAHPYRSVYVRYTAFQTPKVMRSNRDMLVVVATDLITFSDGSTVGYCVWDSLNLTELTAFDVPPGFVRSRMFRSGYFVQNSGERNALSKITYVVGIHAGGFVTRLATRFIMPRFGAVLNRVCLHVRGKRLDPRTFVLQSEWPDKRTARFCKCCNKLFDESDGGDLGSSRLGRSQLGASQLGASRLGASRFGFGATRLFDKRCNCRACGQVVCTSCAQLEEVNVSGVKRVRIPVCIACRSYCGKKPATQESLAASRLAPATQHRETGSAQEMLDLADLI